MGIRCRTEDGLLRPAPRWRDRQEEDQNEGTAHSVRPMLNTSPPRDLRAVGRRRLDGPDPDLAVDRDVVKPGDQERGDRQFACLARQVPPSSRHSAASAIVLTTAAASETARGGRRGVASAARGSRRTPRRYPMPLTLAVAPREVDEIAERERHQAVVDHLAQVLALRQASGELTRDQPPSWLCSAVIVLGHTAGAAVSAGQLTVEDAAGDTGQKRPVVVWRGSLPRSRSFSGQSPLSGVALTAAAGLPDEVDRGDHAVATLRRLHRTVNGESVVSVGIPPVRDDVPTGGQVDVQAVGEDLVVVGCGDKGEGCRGHCLLLCGQSYVVEWTKLRSGARAGPSAHTDRNPLARDAQPGRGEGESFGQGKTFWRGQGQQCS